MKRGRVPVLPVLSFASWMGGDETASTCLLDIGPCIAVESGTAAIALAVRHAGIGAGDKVLLPAFHCRSMVDGATSTGAGADFYRIKPDLSVDMEDLESRCGAGIRLILIAHYFGFPQPETGRVRELCNRRGIIMLEDCAHACFGSKDGKPFGVHGDYAVGSARKFFPLHDGGYIVSAHRDLHDIHPVPAGFKHNVRAAVDIIEEAVNAGRLRPLNILGAPLFALKQRLHRRALRGRSPDSKDPVPTSNSPPRLAMTTVSRRVMRAACKSRIVARRRANYTRMAAILKDARGITLLYPELPEDVVPYMIPILVDDPGRVYPALRNLGVPVYRWEETLQGVCTVTDQYRDRLIQVAIHQELRDAEVEWIGVTVLQLTEPGHRPEVN